MKVSNTQDEESRCLAEYSKDPKIKKEDIQHIMEWLNKGINFPIEGDVYIFFNSLSQVVRLFLDTTVPLLYHKFNWILKKMV